MWISFRCKSGGLVDHFWVQFNISGNDISVTERSHYITQIRAAQKVMRDFDMTFSPFEPEFSFMEL